ncbi:MAG: adenylyl-sulfate kinase [Proteobacteria bacterium]|nr:adenylyl-sulfate kinase [Pseudomonadota bacterium]
MSKARKGVVVWFTGLSGSGKSTLSGRIAELLRPTGLPVELLDGDIIRTNLSKGLGFSKDDRDTNIRRIGFVSRLLARNGVLVFAAAISPYEAIRAEQRQLVEADGADFCEVFMKCQLEVLIQRDVKGLYKRALAGEIENFTGISDPYEPPSRPDVIVESDSETVEIGIKRVLNVLAEKGHVPREVLEKMDI